MSKELTPQEVIVGLAKGLGMDIPETYTGAFGQSVVDTLNTKLSGYKATIPQVYTIDAINQRAAESLASEIATKLGVGSNSGEVALMISEAGDAVAVLNQSATPVSLRALPNTNADNNAGTTTRTETVMETRTVPDRTLSDATINDNKLVQSTFTAAIGRANQMRDSAIVGPMLGLSQPLNNISRRDGTWDNSSLGALNGVIDLLKERNGLSGQFPESGYTPELGAALKVKMDELKNAPIYDLASAGKLRALNQIIDETSRTRVFAALDRLSAGNELRPVGTRQEQVPVEVQVTVPNPTGGDAANDDAANDDAGNDVAGGVGTGTGNDDAGNDAAGNDETNPPVNQDVAVGDATFAVEAVLFQLGGQLDNLPGVGGMISQFGLTDTIIKPLTQADLQDGTFGANSQDLASKLIMGLKMINGDEKADGTYSHAVGENLRVAIMTKPEFQFIRDQIKSADGTPLRMFGAGEGALSGGSAEEQQRLARALLTFDETKPAALADTATDAEKEAYAAKMQERTQFEQTHQKDLQAVRQLNAFFSGMDTLQQNGLYDNNKAKATNQTNIMLDAASGLLDQWAPGIKDWLQDFFSNSQFGQMISGIMSQFFGINVGRLWGDRDDAAALERSQPLIEDNFASFYNAAKNDLGEGADHAAIIAKTRETIMEKMDGGAFKMAMNVIFKGQDEGVIEKAVEDALNAAQNSTDLATAQQAFSQSLLTSGEQFRNGQSLDASETDRLNTYLLETTKELQVIATNPTVPTVDHTANPGAAGAVVGGGSDTDLDVPGDDDDGSQLGSSAAINAVVSPDGATRERATDAPAVDAEVVNAGDKNVELVYTPNKDEWIQGPRRYAHGRVDDLQSVLGNNAEKLGLSLNADGMKNTAGEYSDMFTPYTNAVIEETLIRAQIQSLEDQNIVITQAHLDGFDRKLSVENLDTVVTYMQEQGVSAEEIAKFSAAVVGPVTANGKELEGLAVDRYSTVGNNPLDRTGDPQPYSVLEQSHFGNQFDLKLAQWVPQNNQTAPVDDLSTEDPLRDQYLAYNKDRPCEIPMFFKKEGSNAVYALIRDKNGNDDPADDQFKELTFDQYLSTRRIQDGDAPDLKALLDNYNWENPSDRGVRDVINKVLGIEPFRVTVDMPSATVAPVVPKIPLSVPPLTGAGAGQPHDRPETFRDLRRVTDDQAAFLTEKLGLQNDRGLMRTANRDIKEPLEVMFDRQMRSSGEENGVVFLELAAHGLERPDMDVIVALRNENGNMEFRYIDYETDAIKPIPEQRAGNTDIVDAFDPVRHDTGARRFDDFMDEIDRNNGSHTLQGDSNGYLGMRAIVPDSHGNLRTINGFQAVYGDEMMRGHIRDYVESTSERYAARTAYETRQKFDESGVDLRGQRRVNGIPEAEKERLDELARSGRVRYNATEQYNDASGRSHDATSAGLTLKAYQNTPGIIRGPVTAGAAQIDAIGRIFKNGLFRGNNFTVDDFSPDEQQRLHDIMRQARENRSDMNAEPENDIYNRQTDEYNNNHNFR
tara:strand:- start:34419 stop:38957 length:4539 start_codon:yes stop_codon:yes gene_type:complete